MFERFTDRARRALVIAQEEAWNAGHAVIDPGHILLGLVSDEESPSTRALQRAGVNLVDLSDTVRGYLRVDLKPGPFVGARPFTPQSKKIFEFALREALQLGHDYIGTEHFLLGLMREGDNSFTRACVEIGADTSEIRRAAVGVMAGEPKPETVTLTLPFRFAEQYVKWAKTFSKLFGDGISVDHSVMAMGEYVEKAMEAAKEAAKEQPKALNDDDAFLAELEQSIQRLGGLRDDFLRTQQVRRSAA